MLASIDLFGALHGPTMWQLFVQNNVTVLRGRYGIDLEIHTPFYGMQHRSRYYFMCRKVSRKHSIIFTFTAISRHWNWTGGRIGIKMSSYQYKKFLCGDKTILRWISYTGKTASLYWIRPQVVIRVRGPVYPTKLLSQLLMPWRRKEPGPLHYCDVIMGPTASQITSLTSV